MTENWMIDVLADLRKFAKTNKMGKLVEQLDDTIHIAAIEMAPQNGGNNTAELRPNETTDFLRPACFV